MEKAKRKFLINTFLCSISLSFLFSMVVEEIFVVFYRIRSTSILNNSAVLYRCLEFSLVNIFISYILTLFVYVIFKVIKKKSVSFFKFIGWTCTFSILFCFIIVVGFLIIQPNREELQLSYDFFLLRKSTIVVSLLVSIMLFLPISNKIDKIILSKYVLISLLLICLLNILIIYSYGNAKKLSKTDLHLISVDTLRADRLGCYGYNNATSPNIDRFCQRAVVFDNAFTNTPETVPSYTSIMTGLHIREHKVFNNQISASDDLKTLPEFLEKSEYFSVAILDGILPGTFSNLDQGFDIVIEYGIIMWSPNLSPNDIVRNLLAFFIKGIFTISGIQFDYSLTTDAAIRWLHDLDTNIPLFTHIYWPFPHAPYNPPKHHLSSITSPVEFTDTYIKNYHYDGEVHFTDKQFGIVLEAIKERSPDDDVLIIFTADHGEELGRYIPRKKEKYFGHSLLLNDTSMNIPLIVSPPKIKNVSPFHHKAFVTSRGITSTFLSYANIKIPDYMESPLPLDNKSSLGVKKIFMMMKNHTTNIDRIGIRNSNYLLIETLAPEKYYELYKYQDRTEYHLDYNQYSIVFNDLKSNLHNYYSSHHIPNKESHDNPGELSEREKEVLRSLGYLK